MVCKKMMDIDSVTYIMKLFCVRLKLKAVKPVRILQSLMAKDKTSLHKSVYLSYLCNICGNTCESKVAELKREEVSYFRCRSTVRISAIIHVLLRRSII